MADIVINYGTDISAITIEALEKSDILQYLKKDMKVAVKPNLAVSRPAGEGATTHPEVIKGIVLFLRKNGVSNIKIIESSWIGDSTMRAYEVCGYNRLAEEMGLQLIDLKSDKLSTRTYNGVSIDICREALDCDFLINVPVLKAHCQTLVTCCLKNLKGCISDGSKRNFHALGLHKPIAALSKLINVSYNVIDGICGDLTFEEGGNPITANRIIAGRDSVLLDSYCSYLLGYEPSEIGYLNYARDFGAGAFFDKNAEVLELNADKKPLMKKSYSNTAKKYESMIDADSACSACYASLIFALVRADRKTAAKTKRFVIGQGFKGKAAQGLGVGNCASGCERFVKGCPPKAGDILAALNSEL